MKPKSKYLKTKKIKELIATLDKVSVELADLGAKIEKMKEDIASLVKSTQQEKNVDTSIEEKKFEKLIEPLVRQYSQNSCQHEFPSVWMGLLPPTCAKCGFQAPSYYTTSLNMDNKNLME